MVAQVAILLQCFADDALEFGGKVGVQPDGGRGLAIENGFEDVGGTVAPEGKNARRHLVEHSAAGEEVAAGVHFFGSRLFGRHVGYGAERRAGAGEVLGVWIGSGHCVGRGHLARRSGGGIDFGQSEIEDFGVAALGDENIGGLDVAVDDSFGVRGVESVGDFDGEIQENVGLQRLARDAMLQRHAVEEFHGDEGPTVLLSDLVDGADVGMVQGRGRLGFALETGQRLGIFGHLIGKKFEGHEAVQGCVFGFVNDAHSAAAQLFYDEVMRDGLADHLGQVIRLEARLYSRFILRTRLGRVNDGLRRRPRCGQFWKSAGSFCWRQENRITFRPSTGVMVTKVT